MFSTVVSSGGLGLRMMSLMLSIMSLPNGRKNAASVNGVGAVLLANGLSSFLFLCLFYYVFVQPLFSKFLWHLWQWQWHHARIFQKSVSNVSCSLAAENP